MARPTTVTVFGDTTIASNDVEDEEANSTSISGPPGLEICDPEIGCSRSDAIIVRELHDTDSNADRAGQRVGEPYRRGLLASEMCGLDGEAQRRPAGSSGNEEDPVGGCDPDRHGGDFENGGRRQLIDIACIPDQGGRLDALWQNLTATASEAAARQLFGIVHHQPRRQAGCFMAMLDGDCRRSLGHRRGQTEGRRTTCRGLKGVCHRHIMLETLLYSIKVMYMTNEVINITCSLFLLVPLAELIV